MHHRSTRTTGLVFGGLMAALVVVFALVPFLSVFLPIPLVLAYVRYGGRVAGLTAVVALLFSALFVGFLQAFLLLVSGVLPGLVFGYGFYHKWRPLSIAMLSVVVFVVGAGMEYMVTRVVLLGGQDPIAQGLQAEGVRAQLNDTWDRMEKAAQVPPGATEYQKQAAEWQLGLVRDMRADPVRMAWVLAPFGLFFIGSITTWLNYSLCKWVLPRFGHELPSPMPFAEFRLPAWLTWVYALGMVGFQAVTMGGVTLLNSPWWIQLLFNVVMPMILIFVLAGLAVAYGFLLKQGVSRVQALLLSLLGFMAGPVGPMLYVMLAMSDSVFDFRRLGHGVFNRADNP